jgi:hypothetical protein
LSGVLGLVNLVWSDWIEVVFGVDPDGHSGALEWATVAALVVVALGFGVLARSTWAGRADVASACPRQHGRETPPKCCLAKEASSAPVFFVCGGTKMWIPDPTDFAAVGFG